MKKIAPNDQCPCGSGRKYGKCCLRRKGDNAAKAFFYHNLGTEYSENGKREMAFSCFHKALTFNPEFVGAYNDLGVALKEDGKVAEAISCYERALAINPAYAAGLNNLAEALHLLGRFDEAVASCRRALAINPDFAQAYNNMGNSLIGMGRFDDGIESLQKALALIPDYVEVYNTMGIALKEQGNYDDAIGCFQKALAIKPRYGDAYNNLGGPLQDRGRHDEAVLSLRQAVAIMPDKACILSNLLMSRQYAFACSSEELFEEALEYGRRFEEPLTGRWTGHDNLRDPEKRLKVGLVSGDLRGHPVGFFLEGIISHLESDSLGLYAYATQNVTDDLSKRIKPCFEKWAFVKGLSDEELAARIRADGIDILVDLSGHTAENRLLAFALKPAPLQVTWLGYPNTTGLRSMDYILADPITAPPEEEKYYSEKILRLPESYLCYAPPAFDLGVNPLPALENGFVTFGSFNNPAKINDAVVECWARVLSAVPGSRLLLKFGNVFGRETEQENFRRRFSIFGIDPGRIGFDGYSSHAELFASYNRVDLALDPFPYTGVTTSCEALWMGVPTLTLRMQRGIFGHNGELIMRSTGLSDWVAGSIEEYVAKGAAFAADTAHLASLRAGLRQALLASPLCDAPRFARHLQAALRGIWREWCSQNP